MCLSITIQNNAPRKGWATFIHGTMFYIKSRKEILGNLSKRNLNFRLVMDATDWPTPALLIFSPKVLIVRSLTKEDAMDKSKWDAKLTAESKVFINYFLGKNGVIMPLIPVVGKIRATKMLNLLKLIWFVKAVQNFYSGNSMLSLTLFLKSYNYDHPPNK